MRARTCSEVQMTIGCERIPRKGEPSAITERDALFALGRNRASKDSAEAVTNQMHLLTRLCLRSFNCLHQATAQFVQTVCVPTNLGHVGFVAYAAEPEVKLCEVKVGS